MFENYTATKRDLETVKEALTFILRPELRFIFSDLSRIIKTLTISYDSKFIYIWSLDPIKLTKISHNLEIPDKWQMGWWANIISRELKKYLPNKIGIPMISGGLLTPFIALQKAKNISDNPYITRESYLATIVHEFGHVYFEGNNKKGELSAFCTEYYASQLFWPNHIEKLNKFIEMIRKNTPTKTEHNDQHIFALLNANKFITRYPKVWPIKLMAPLLSSL